MSMGDRIRTARREKKLSQPQLAKLTKVGQSTISDLENNKKSTSADNLESIAQVLGVSSSYLLTGKTVENIAECITSNVSEKLQRASNFGGISFPTSELITIRYYPDLAISCGSGSFGEVLEKSSEELTINYSGLKDRHILPSMCVAFPATGDSMSPTIKHKDLVFVDIGRTSIRDGKIFALCHGGLFKFKRLYNLPMGGVRIVSDNCKEFPEEKLTAQEIIEQQFEVIGWVWSWQSMETW